MLKEIQNSFISFKRRLILRAKQLLMDSLLFKIVACKYIKWGVLDSVGQTLKRARTYFLRQNVSLRADDGDNQLFCSYLCCSAHFASIAPSPLVPSRCLASASSLPNSAY